MLPCFGDSVAGHPSHMLQPQARRLVLATCSWVKGPVTRGTQRFSRLSLWLFHEWDFQSLKTLSKFFQIFRLWSVLAGDPSDLLATCFSREKRMFCISKTVFKTILVFPSNFYDCSMSSPFLSQLNLTKHSMSHSSNSIFASFLLQYSRKRYGFSLSHLISSCFENYFLDF